MYIYIYLFNYCLLYSYLYISSRRVPGCALYLVVHLHLDVVVLVILLCQDELVAVPSVLESLFGADHGVEGAALLGVHHLPDLLLCGEPESWLHDPPVGVRASSVELSEGLQTFPDGRHKKK